MNTTPIQMYLGARKDCYTLTHQPINNDKPFVTVEIKFHYDVERGESPNHYKKTIYKDGEVYTLVSSKDYFLRVQAIEDNEGLEIAEQWQNEQTEWIVADRPHCTYRSEWLIAEQMIKQWEAMQTLGLFTPGVRC